MLDPEVFSGRNCMRGKGRYCMYKCIRVTPKWKVPENLENLCVGLKTTHPHLFLNGSVGCNPFTKPLSATPTSQNSHTTPLSAPSHPVNLHHHSTLATPILPCLPLHLHPSHLAPHKPTLHLHPSHTTSNHHTYNTPQTRLTTAS